MRRESIVAEARLWLGTPYRHQAALRGAGCDCLGLLRGLWRELYGIEPMDVPPYRADWRDTRHAGALLEAAERLLSPAGGEARAGQVVLFRLGRVAVPRHCGVLTGPERFIHAQEKLGVVEASLSEGLRRRIAGRFEFPMVED